VSAGRPRAVVVVTGSELVRGDRRDANGPYLAAELGRLGLEPSRIVIVGDAETELEAAVRDGLEADLCVLTGGLGPTHDDRTVEVLARVTGRRLVVDEALEREIERVSRAVAERLRRPYGDFAGGVRKQASLPEGATALGLAGTAPAVLLQVDGRVAVALPGPPGELRRLWSKVVESGPVGQLLERVGAPERRVLRFFGPSESAVARALDEAGGEGEGLAVTVCARDLEIHVDFVVEPGGEARAEALESALRDRFPAELFADDERPVEELVLQACRSRGWKLGAAESSTGGLVAARLTSVPGSSDVFVGGVVAYANEAKEAALGVPRELLATHGAVSAEAAEAMAVGARERLGVDVAVAVTGIAGPGGGTADKPVGLVFLHGQSPEAAAAREVHLPGDRDDVRARATALALHLLRRLLIQPGTNARARAG